MLQILLAMQFLSLIITVVPSQITDEREKLSQLQCRHSGNSQKVVDAGPGDHPLGAAFGEGGKRAVGGRMPGRIVAMGIDEDMESTAIIHHGLRR